MSIQTLPIDILYYEIALRLDIVSRYLLRVALHLADFPCKYEYVNNERMQKQIIADGISIMELFRSENLLQLYNVPKYAVMTGRIDVLKFMENNRYYQYRLPINCYQLAFHDAPMLRYLLDRQMTLPDNIAALAAEQGDLEFLKMMNIHQLSQEIQHEALDSAVVAGNTDCVRYLLRGNIIRNSKIALDAVINGHLDIVRLLHEHINFDMFAMSALPIVSAINGDIPMLQYLLSICHNLPRERIINTASKNGHTEFVDYVNSL